MCAADGRHEPCPRSQACHTVSAAGACVSLSAVPVIRASPCRELNDAGWKMIERGDGARAAKFFADALALEPDQPVLLLGAGAAAHLAGRPKDALTHLRRALDLDPRLTQAALLLAEIAYSEGDVAVAIATLEKALKYLPNDPDLTQRLAAWRAEADLHRDFESAGTTGSADVPGLRIRRARRTGDGRAECAFWQIGAKLGAYPAAPSS